MQFEYEFFNEFCRYEFSRFINSGYLIDIYLPKAAKRYYNFDLKTSVFLCVFFTLKEAVV